MSTQIASDSFNRASLGTNWTQTDSAALTFDIISSTAVGLTGGNNTASAAIVWAGTGTFQPSQYSQVTYTAENTASVDVIDPAVLITGNSYYEVTPYAGTFYIRKITTGTSANLANGGSRVIAPGDVLLLTAVPGVSSTVLTAYINGTQAVTYTDSSSPFLTGTPGIGGYVYNNSYAVFQVTPWSAGDNTTQTLATPTFSPVAGTYTSTQTVTITSSGVGEAIYWNTTGSPTSGSTLYTGPITVSASETVYAIAELATWNNSAVGSAAYVINSATAYSVPDCRVTKPNMATGETKNGTILYDSQTSSNAVIPPTDSREAGAPVASGTYPQNSRTPGTYGPGE